MVKYSLLLITLVSLVFSCSTTPDLYSFDNAIEAGIRRIEIDLPEGADIAIIDFKSDNENLSGYILEELYDKLINGRKFVVMERSRTDAIAKEVNYQFSGEVDDNEIINIGHQLGADYVITGQLSFSGSAYRLRIFAIDIEKGRRIASSSLNINANDPQIRHFISNTQNNTQTQNSQIISLNRTTWTGILKSNDGTSEITVGLNFTDRNFRLLVIGRDWQEMNAGIYSLNGNTLLLNYNSGSSSTLNIEDNTIKGLNVDFKLYTNLLNGTIWDAMFESDGDPDTQFLITLWFIDAITIRMMASQTQELARGYYTIERNEIYINFDNGQNISAFFSSGSVIFSEHRFTKR